MVDGTISFLDLYNLSKPYQFWTTADMNVVYDLTHDLYLYAFAVGF